MLSLTPPRHTSTLRIPAGWSRPGPFPTMMAMCRGWNGAQSVPTRSALALLDVIRRKGTEAII